MRVDTKEGVRCGTQGSAGLSLSLSVLGEEKSPQGTAAYQAALQREGKGVGVENGNVVGILQHKALQVDMGGMERA